MSEHPVKVPSGARKQTENYPRPFQLLIDLEREIATLEKGKVIRKSLEFISGRLGVRHSSIALLDDGRQGFSVFDGTDGDSPSGKERFLPLAGTVLSVVIRSGKPLYRPDLAAWSDRYEADANLFQAQTRSDFLVPLVVDGRSIGTMNGGAPDVDGISGDTRTQLALIAPRLARALESALLFQELKASEAKYRDLFEHANDAILILDDEFSCQDVNRKAVDMFGYSREEFLRMRYPDFLASEDSGRIPGEMRALLAKGSYEKFVTRMRTKDGRWLEVEISSSPIRRGGKVVGSRDIIRDITVQRHVEDRLRDSEERFRAMAELLPQTVFEMDLTGRLTFVNENAYDYFGYSREDFEQGISAYHLIAPGDRSRAMENAKRILAGDHAGIQEYTFVRKDRQVFPAIFHAAAIFNDGRIVGLRGIIVDITNRKRAERELVENRERLYLLIERMPVGCIMWNPKFRVELWNPAATRIFGFAPEEAMGKHAYDLIVPLSVRQHTDAIWRRLLEGDQTAHSENENITKDGRKIICEWYNTPVHDDNGEIIGIISMAQDITARKRAEEQEQKLQNQLRQSQKMESIGRLAGGIAHDFNNMLSAIIGYSDLVLLKLSENNPLRQNLFQIKAAGEKAAALTRQLLAFSRQQILEMEVLNLNAVIEDLGKMLRRLIGEDIELVFSLEAPVQRVLADQVQIEQVLINLAVNARDAMPKGGKLTIHTENCEIDEFTGKLLGGLKAGDYVMLTVTDTGQGMSRETQERIFEPFYTTKESGKGTGLGLATVYGIVKQHGGHVTVSSEPGEGTLFTVYFPTTKERERRRTHEQAKTMQGGNETVLIVEDDPLILQLVVNTLEPLGYRILKAQTGADALALMEGFNEPIDALISDMVMPGMNGMELVESIRRTHPSIKVIFMSGYSEEVMALRGIQSKGTHFLQKPLMLRQLITMLREVLSGTVSPPIPGMQAQS